MAKTLLTNIIVLILAFQLLPIKELSQKLSLLTLSEDTEDVSTEKKDTEKEEDESETKKVEWQLPINIESVFCKKFKKRTHLIKNSFFFTRIFDDIPTPPPLFKF
jgi:hypothetical protein